MSAPLSDSPATLAFDGLDTGWAFVALIALSLGLWFWHRRAAAHIPRSVRRALVALRILIVALLLAIATRPVLTHEQSAELRPRLLVLLDRSASMEFNDIRTRPEDRRRAAIALGLAAPGSAAEQDQTHELPDALTRTGLVRALSANARLDLWSRLSEQADLIPYTFGASLSPGPTALPGESANDHIKRWLADLPTAESATALGEALESALARHQTDPLAGVLVLTDGASNTGRSPAEALPALSAAKLPLLLVGLGVESAPDLSLRAVDAPRLGFLGERIVVRARLATDGLPPGATTVTLREGERELASAPAMLEPGVETTVELSWQPERVGETTLIVSASPALDESIADNNTAEFRINIIDTRVRVLLLEQEPRWDYRYLLDFIRDDRRLHLTAHLIDGDDSLLRLPDTPFLAQLPDPVVEREVYYRSDIILLGDVDPARLGPARLQLIRDWVDQGGGLVLLAGRLHNPVDYVGTPLADLFPATPIPVPRETYGLSYPIDRAPVPRLTAAGRASPLLALAGDPAANARLWAGFSPVRWTAAIGPAKPGAEVLLEDPFARPARPLLARMRYGRGEVVYLGFNETFRWRSRLGGRHYARIWGQLFQSLALERLAAASRLVQLSADRPDYRLGETVTISGQLFTRDFTPLDAASVAGSLRRLAPDGSTISEQTLELGAVPGMAGSFRTSLTASAPGRYELTTPLDPLAVVGFNVDDFNLEANRPGLDLAGLRGLATEPGVTLFREDDIHTLPERLSASPPSTLVTLRRVELWASPWLLAALILLACADWTLRRLNQLK